MAGRSIRESGETNPPRITPSVTIKFRRAEQRGCRIRLPHVFDPYAAVNASHGEPLPHQLSAVYRSIPVPHRSRCPSAARKRWTTGHRDTLKTRPP